MVRGMLCLGAAAMLTAAGPVGAQDGAAIRPADRNGTLVQVQPIASRHTASPRLTLWLPRGYPAPRTRYRVLYMPDGQNLFDPKLSGYGKVWGADVTAQRLIDEGAAKPFIIVGTWNAEGDRYRTYLPDSLYRAAKGQERAEMVRSADSKPVISAGYLRYLTSELKPWVDRNYRTLPGPSDTAIMGSSMGGLISVEALAKYPRVFGRAGALSIHWPMGDPRTMNSEGAGMKALWKTYLTRTLGAPRGRRLWIDRGTATLDQYYGPYFERGVESLKAAGWRQGKDFRAEVYHGTEHDERAWAERLDEVLAWLWSDDG
ncbi:alpha/beta hydrolase-fold protein [Sphingomonas sp. BGYR3]|uniref:alpha/beta hydrolase n=1 Tax=Sphingomonas sp. BGYR3 TaxID=2975483 RepID=UPI0021A2BB9A|nr:alpha/beta hydrolase-fold protein [Sphingomonas sp. BGYR3]MDG5487039.1 alpha/beta hydrolase-fold protein [Sphingomonas sp. BGYR3]